jgi:hypothetical protein
VNAELPLLRAAQEAWQSALGQLQMEMPKASFDTWVRDTRVIGFDDGQLSIGVRNAYARDWLESRLSSTVTRLLMGIMNQNVSVLFAVVTGEPEAEENEAETEEGETGDGLAEEKAVLVEADYDLFYDEIVNPDQVTLVSRYFLRHLRLIGPDLGWLYLAFRQAAFNAGARSGIKRERFSGKAIASLAGIAERTFWNRIGKAETWQRLAGLVTTTEAAPEWDTSSPTPRRLPRRYIVHMSLPLTAVDAQSLRTWLTAHVESAGGPEPVIEVAIAESLDVLLPVDPTTKKDDAGPETIAAILRSLFGETIPAERLATLATRLQKHIMPDNDRVGVTHFFVEHILPHLGAGPGWMLTLLRDRCWKDKVTGESRDLVRVPGGYAEIAGWLGVTPATIWRWLYGKHSASRGRSKPIEGKGKEQQGPGRPASEAGKLSFPVLSVYLHNVDRNGRSSQSLETAPRTFQVLQEEIPAEILEAVLDEEKGRALDHALAAIRAVCSIDDAVIRAVCSIGFARFADDSRAVCSIVFARFADDVRAVCRVFKSLNLLNRISNNFNQPASAREIITGTTAEIEPGGRVDLFSSGGEDWDLEKLFKSMDIHPKTQARLRAANIPAWALVAWLLQAGTMRGVEDPIRFAISRVLNPETRFAAEQNFIILAKKPAALLHEIKVILHPFGKLCSGELDPTYKRALGNSPAFASALWRFLTGEENCEGVSVTREKTTTEWIS